MTIGIGARISAPLFPAAIDRFPNPGPNDDLNNVTAALKHDQQHQRENDAINAIERKVGIDNSTDTNSLDYRARHVRVTKQVVSSSIANNASDNTQVISVGKGCMVLRIQTSAAVWVRVYSTAAYQTADSARAQTTDPTGEHGVLLEAITTSGNLTLDLSPAALCYSLESSPGATVHLTITNLSGSTAAITVTLTVLPVEV